MASPPKSRPIRILYANDGSQHARAGIDLINDLQLGANSQIINLGVLVPRESSSHAVVEHMLADSKRLLDKEDLEVFNEFRQGYPAEIIIKIAEEIKPDLIVLGAKGLRATLGILLGGVAQQVVEYACCPSLIVRAPYTGLNRILLVTDGSIYSNRAIKYLAGGSEEDKDFHCISFPLPTDVDLRVMHVLSPLPSPELIARTWPVGPDLVAPYTSQFEAEESILDQEESAGKEILDAAISKFKKCGIQAKSVFLRGDAATEIIEYSKTHNIDMIVAGSRGLNPVRSWLLGSVSRKLVHYANCSVLIVKGEPIQNSD